MARALMWLRLASLMLLPALGSMGLLVSLRTRSDAVVIESAILIGAAGVAAVVLFIGYTVATFSFPKSLPKALAVTFFTPLLLIVTSVLLGWGPWLFLVDECFAEIGGMTLACAIAAVVAGRGGLRIVGGAVFGAIAAGALYVFATPMLALRKPDALWIGLNLLAIGWSFYVYLEMFLAHARRTPSKGQPSPPEDDGYLTLDRRPLAAIVIGSIGLWLGGVIAGAVIGLDQTDERPKKSQPADTSDQPRKRRGRRQRR